jgi:hypothetical protein
MAEVTVSNFILRGEAAEDLAARALVVQFARSSAAAPRRIKLKRWQK